MQKVIEPLGFLIYIILLLYMGVYIYRNHKCNKVHMIFGSMALTLAIGEALYIIPRTYALLTTGLEDNLTLLGWGRIGHMIVITLFFSMLIDLKRESFELRKKVPLDKFLYGLLLFRVVLGIFPQNGHFQLEPDRTFLILRTIPLIAYLGIIALVIITLSIKRGNMNMTLLALVLLPIGVLVEPEFIQTTAYWQLIIKAALRGLLLLGIVFIGFKDVRRANELSRF
ncbi:MAG: hypothetical protein ACQEP4_07840 [Bacillota bacterium]